MVAKNTEKVWDRALGKRLRDARLREDMTMKGVAYVLGVTWQMYRKYETGECRVPANRLPLLAETLKTTLAALMTAQA